MQPNTSPLTQRRQPRMIQLVVTVLLVGVCHISGSVVVANPPIIHGPIDVIDSGSACPATSECDVPFDIPANISFSSNGTSPDFKATVDSLLSLCVGPLPQVLKSTPDNSTTHSILSVYNITLGLPAYWNGLAGRILGAERASLAATADAVSWIRATGLDLLREYQHTTSPSRRAAINQTFSAAMDGFVQAGNAALPPLRSVYLDLTSWTGDAPAGLNAVSLGLLSFRNSVSKAAQSLPALNATLAAARANVSACNGSPPCVAKAEQEVSRVLGEIAAAHDLLAWAQNQDALLTNLFNVVHTMLPMLTSDTSSQILFISSDSKNVVGDLAQVSLSGGFFAQALLLTAKTQGIDALQFGLPFYLTGCKYMCG